MVILRQCFSWCCWKWFQLSIVSTLSCTITDISSNDRQKKSGGVVSNTSRSSTESPWIAGKKKHNPTNRWRFFYNSWNSFIRFHQRTWEKIGKQIAHSKFDRQPESRRKIKGKTPIFAPWITWGSWVNAPAPRFSQTRSLRLRRFDLSRNSDWF